MEKDECLERRKRRKLALADEERRRAALQKNVVNGVFETPAKTTSD